MRSSAWISSLVFIALLILAYTSNVRSQSSDCRSESVDKNVRCANIYVEFGDVTTSRLSGIVDSPLDVPIVVEIYKINRSERRKDSYKLIQGREPTIAIETNAEGKFCHPGLADGHYVVRFGTSDGGWNCSWIKVHILKGSIDKKIKVDLTLGT
jgi:hypothetical protein